MTEVVQHILLIGVKAARGRLWRIMAVMWCVWVGVTLGCAAHAQGRAGQVKDLHGRLECCECGSQRLIPIGFQIIATEMPHLDLKIPDHRLALPPEVRLSLNVGVEGFLDTQNGGIEGSTVMHLVGLKSSSTVENVLCLEMIAKAKCLDQENSSKYMIPSRKQSQDRCGQNGAT